MTYNTNNDTKNMNYVHTWLSEAPDYAIDFINYKMGHEASSNTLRAYTARLDEYSSWLNKNVNCSVFDVTSVDAEKFMKHLSSAFSTSTVLSTISAVSSMYSFFLKRNLVQKNPFKNLQRPTVEKSKKHKLNQNEIDAFLYVVDTGHNMPNRFLSQELSHGTRCRNRALMKTLIDTSMSMSELVGIDIRDVRATTNSIILKGQTPRIVTVSDDTMVAIQDCIRMRTLLNVPSDETALFTASQGKNKNKRISAQTVDGLIKKYALAAGLDISRINPNSLRSEIGE